MTLPRREIVLALYVIVIFSSGNSAVKFVVNDIPPMTALGLRFALTALIFAPFCKWPGWQQIGIIAQIAILLSVLHQGLIFWSLTRVDVSLSIILLQTQVIFGTILGWLCFRESVGWRSLLGILLGISGVAVLVGLPDESPDAAGTIGLLLSAFFISIAYTRMKALEAMSAPTYIAWLHTVATPFVLGTAFLLEDPAQIDPAAFTKPGVLGGLIWLTLMLSTAHLLWQRLMSRNPISQIVPFTLLMPFTGIALALPLFGDSLGPAFIGGSLLTVAGVATIVLRRRNAF